MTRKNEVVCAYGNCQETMVAGQGFKLTITESRMGTVWDRQAFCCLEHAWRALKRRDERLNGPRPVMEAQL